MGIFTPRAPHPQSPPIEVPQGLALPQALNAIEMQIRDRPIENAAAITPYGVVAWTKTEGGTETRLLFTKQELDALHGCWITHNHPDNGPFSDLDIRMGLAYGALGVRATRGTSVDVMNFNGKTGMWESIAAWRRINKLDRVLWDQHGMDERIKRGELTKFEAECQHWDRLWQQLAAERGYTFYKQARPWRPTDEQHV